MWNSFSKVFLIYSTLCLFVISLQKGVFKGAHNILLHRVQDKGGKANWSPK